MVTTRKPSKVATMVAHTPYRLELSPAETPSDNERERLRRLFDSVMHRRERIGPIGIRSDILVQEAREEDGG